MWEDEATFVVNKDDRIEVNKNENVTNHDERTGLGKLDFNVGWSNNSWF